MTDSTHICIIGEDRVLTEALSIALRTRGLLTTVVCPGSVEILEPGFVPDVIILALQGSSTGARERLASVSARFPSSESIVLGLTGMDLFGYALGNLTQCMLKIDSFEKLIRTLEFLHDDPASRPPRVDSDTIGDSGPDLTIREREIFKSVSAGLSNKEIAALFSISTSTVKNHIHNILTKLNIRRRGYVLGCTYIPRTAPTRQNAKSGEFCIDLLKH
jgi:DNA-binding NarL/FixJ family response regulator